MEQTHSPGSPRAGWHDTGDLLQTAARAATGNARGAAPGERAYQPAGVGMFGIAQQLVDRRFFGHASRIHDDDALRGLGNNAEVMGDQDDRRAQFFLEFQHQVQDLRLDRDVEGGGWLVGDEHCADCRQGRSLS